jgi:very-short-patch-repair endonuclease
MQGRRRELYRIAEAQRGLVTREDLRSLGLTRNVRARLLAEGTLTTVGRRTYQIGGSSPDALRASLLASVDAGGPVSHRSATTLHGIPGIRAPERPDVLVVRKGKPVGSEVATVHTTTWLPADDVTTVDGIPCTSVARSLFNLAGMIPTVSAETVTGAVDDAIAMGRASDAWLWWRLEKLRCRGRSGVANLEAILVRRAGGAVTESWLEREFLRLLSDAGVATPRCQRRIRAQGAFVARVDFLYEDLGIVVEVTGAGGHSSREQRARDATRRNRLGMQGFLVLEFTYEQVVGCPVEVVDELLRAMQSRHAFRRPASI